jgi:hypothetical protein
MPGCQENAGRNKSAGASLVFHAGGQKLGYDRADVGMKAVVKIAVGDASGRLAN